MYVHEDCLKRWLETSQSNKCEVCGFIFRFKSIWKLDTPDSLPVSEIMQGLYKSLTTALCIAFHRSLVIFMWGIMLPLATAILYETAFPENESDTGVITRMSKMFKLFNLTYQILRFNVNPADWYTGIGVVVFNCVTVIGMLYLREQLLQVIERTRNEQRDRIRNQVERDNIGLNDAIQRAMQTVDQLRDADRNIDFARQLTENLDEIENSDGELGHGVLLPNGLEHVEELENGVFNPQNRDAFSFTDDDSEIGENQNVGSVEVDNRPYPRVDNVRITRNLGSGDNVHVDDVSGTDETAENNDDDDPLYEGEFTPNSGSSFEYSDVSYNESDDSEEWSSYTEEEDDAATAAAQPLRHNQIGNGDFTDNATPNNENNENLENEENLIQNHQNLRYRGAANIHNQENQQPAPQNAYADQNPAAQNERGNLQNFLDDFNEFDEDLDNLENPEINIENGEENDNLGMINNLDITWQGVIGVDGSFQFFEHVFYALIINGVALYVFWVTPMVIGKIVFGVIGEVIFGVSKVPRILNPIKTAVFIMIGYTSIAAFLGVIGKLRKVLYIRKRMKFVYVISRFSNNVYLWMKVALLMFNELMVYPTIIGVWINICTIDMVGNTGEYRINTFEKNPLSILFAHWFAGMTTVFQFVSAVMAIRKVTRPGLIWFVRNLDDQDYSPLKDMLESTSFIHIKRFCYTCALLGWCIFVCVWVPSTAVKSMGIVDLPFSKARYVGSIEAANNSTILNGNSTVGAVNLTVLDGNSTILDNATVFDDLTVPDNSTVLNNLTVSGVAEPTSGSEANFSETYLNPISILNDIPKHFILLQILVPMLNMDGQRLATKFLSKFINLWCLLVGQLLGLRTYLMGMSEENEDETGPVYQPKMVTRNLDNMPGGARQFVMGKYKRKSFFQFRIFGFLSALVFTLSFISGVLLFVPILTGRKAIYQIHKIYVAASNEPRLDGPVEQILQNSTFLSENVTNSSQSKILAKYGQTEVVNAWILGAFLLWVPINLFYILYKSLLKTLPILKNLQTKDYISKIKNWSKYSVKLFAFLTLVAVIMPIILGVFTTTVVISPLKVDKNEDSIIYLTNDWIFGFLLQKIFVGMCLVAPAEWGWREIVGGLHRNGEGVDLKYTVRLCLRAVNLMAVTWAAPYLLAYGILPLAFSGDFLVNIQHAIYPSILAMIGGVLIAKWNFSCFQALCDGIKQKRYLLGNQLINNEDTR